jgi:hypothetical protein
MPDSGTISSADQVLAISEPRDEPCEGSPSSFKENNAGDSKETAAPVSALTQDCNGTHTPTFTATLKSSEKAPDCEESQIEARVEREQTLSPMATVEEQKKNGRSARRSKPVSLSIGSAIYDLEQMRSRGRTLTGLVWLRFCRF